MKIVQAAASQSQFIMGHCKDRTFTYGNLLAHSSLVQQTLLKDTPHLRGSRVAMLMPQAYEYVASQWGIWRAGGVAVPLCGTHPLPEWDYVLQDCQASTLLVHKSFAEAIKPLGSRLPENVIQLDDFAASQSGPAGEDLDVDGSDPALIVYTSGTTGRPKGVVTNHQAVLNRVEMLWRAWAWQSTDHILEVMPLHHIHGIENVLLTALYSGARVSFHERFESTRIIRSFCNTTSLNMFMGVPAMYNRLLWAYDRLSHIEKELFAARCADFRLMVSGSSALPQSLLVKWREVTGQVLLERYGMTECGMILTNPLNGERKAGSVGKPFPGVSVRVDNGELLVKSAGMFTEYFNRPETTAAAFTEDGWFKTGDIVQEEDGEYKILGRANIDIIKTGGYRVSAIDIERELSEHPEIREIAIVGLPSHEYGQVIGAVLVARRTLSLEELQEWSRNRIAAYKKPRKLVQVDVLPKNAGGKVNKAELLGLFQSAT